MPIDLRPDPTMAPTVGLLYATVTDTYQRLKALVAEMTQAEVEFKGPNGSLNSTAQLLKHLAAVDLHWVYRFKGEPVPAVLKDTYGPMMDPYGKLPVVQGVPVSDLVAAYDRVHEMLRVACLGLSDSDLERTVPYENGAEATIRWGIWHIADHSRYHQAHINWLKDWAR